MLTDNFVLHQKAKQYEWKGESLLSIKTFSFGKAFYTIGARSYEVSEENYLVLDNCTSYRIEIDSAEPTEAFCVFFSQEFIRDASNTLTQSESALLELPESTTNHFLFYERNYPHGDLLSGRLKRSKQLYELLKHDSVWSQEFYFSVFHGLVATNAANRFIIDKIKQAKYSTRRELYKRICYAKDYIDACISQELTIEKLSNVALLSPTHLMRIFKSVFGLSPHQYIIKKRMDVAQALLKSTNLTISDIMMQAGYVSLSNFSWVFKCITGQSPSGFRKSNFQELR